MANHRRIKIIVFFCAIPVCLFLATFPLPFTDKTSPPSHYQQNKFFEQTSQEVTVHFISGKEKGPTLLIFGGIHGDEAAGYLTAERYVRIKIKKGNLIVVPCLNASAISKGKRQGLGGDMNRLFDLSGTMSQRNPDAKVVDLAKSLIQRADYVINLHQAYDFYAPRWISRQRNPSKWGQSIIDTPVYHLHNGEKLEPGRFAQKVSRRSNNRIMDRNFHFLVNNTDTSGHKSRHKEQQGSLTYYALTKQHKVSLAVEATKNCSLPEAIAFLTIAVNSALEEAGIQPDPPPSDDFLMISREMKEKRRQDRQRFISCGVESGTGHGQNRLQQALLVHTSHLRPDCQNHPGWAYHGTGGCGLPCSASVFPLCGLHHWADCPGGRRRHSHIKIHPASFAYPVKMFRKRRYPFFKAFIKYPPGQAE